MDIKFISGKMASFTNVKSAASKSRRMSMASATPTSALPSLRMAAELSGQRSGRSTKNMEHWLALLSSLAVGVPSPQLAVELQSTTYDHVVSKDQNEAIEFRNPLDPRSLSSKAHRREVAGASDRNEGRDRSTSSSSKRHTFVYGCKTCGMPQPVSKKVSDVFMKWRLSYHEDESGIPLRTVTMDASASGKEDSTIRSTSTENAVTSNVAETQAKHRFRRVNMISSTLMKLTGSKKHENRQHKARHNYFMRTVLSKITNSAKKKEHTTKLIRSGVPPELRGTIWELCCGSRRKCLGISRHPKASPLSRSYGNLVDTSMHKSTTNDFSIPEPLRQTIERDIIRTNLNESALFKTDFGHKQLRRVLYAFALRRPDIGYCQAMNFLAAVFLTHMSEEAAFWALSAVVEDLVPGYYSASMMGIRRDAQVFAGFIRRKLPSLFEHCQSLKLVYEPLIMKWFLCIYVNTLPFHTALRVWDCFLHEGVKVLFRVGIMIMKVLEPKLLAATDFGSLWEILTNPMSHIAKDVGRSKARGREEEEVTASSDMNDILSGDALIQAAFNYTNIGTMSTKDMEELRTRVVANDDTLT